MGMNKPAQPADVPDQGATSDHNPTGTTPHGIPDGMSDHDAKGHPTDDRQATETATQEIEK